MGTTFLGQGAMGSALAATTTAAGEPVTVWNRSTGRGFYSGSEDAYRNHRPSLDQWGASTYFGPDAGLASLYDLAMLTGMYTMIAGFLHGAAMVGAEGVTDDVLAPVHALVRQQIDAGFGDHGTARLFESLRSNR